MGSLVGRGEEERSGALALRWCSLLLRLWPSPSVEWRVIRGCISIVTMRSKRESHSGVRVRGHPLSLRGAYPQRGAQPLGKFGHCANVCVREKGDGQSQTKQNK